MKRFNKGTRGSVKKNIGFYISLALCLTAVAGAAWTTYGSIGDQSGYTDELSDTEEIDAANEVSGESYERSVPAEDSSRDESRTAESKKDTSQVSVSSAQEASAGKADTVPVSGQPERAVNPAGNGEIIKEFSVKDPLMSKTMGDWRTHSGIDVRADSGTPVKAMYDGKVTKLTEDPLLGNIIQIEHDGGYEAWYCGVTDTPNTSEGAIVKAGETIGFIGVIPSEQKDESHLHLEVKYEDHEIDPSLLF